MNKKLKFHFRMRCFIGLLCLGNILIVRPVLAQSPDVTRWNESFVRITRKTLPVVVNITVWKKKNHPAKKGVFSWDKIGEGSGVIVSSKGFIITNEHVIANGDQFRITLTDGRDFRNVPIGPQNTPYLSDRNTDIALLKVGLAEGEELPVIPLGNSAELEVGEWVIAVGNPFGLRQTVTAGIVSAKGRVNVGFADYEDFIQTDAAINPGNSGGALVNLKGELMGINTAIKTNTGGYQGVSFAIPINMVKSISKMLLKYGKILRGWMGFYTRNRPLADNLKKDRVEVVSVLAYSPAFQAGLKEKDIILKFDGQVVRSYLHLRNLIATSEVGKKVHLDVDRNGKGIRIPILVGERPESDRVRYLRKKAIEALGLDVREMAGRRGVKVIFVRESSPAQISGIKKGDILIEMGNLVIRDRADFNNAVEQLSDGRDFRVMISRQGNFIFHHLRPSFPEDTANN